MSDLGLRMGATSLSVFTFLYSMVRTVCSAKRLNPFASSGRSFTTHQSTYSCYWDQIPSKHTAYITHQL